MCVNPCGTGDEGGYQRKWWLWAGADDWRGLQLVVAMVGGAVVVHRWYVWGRGIKQLQHVFLCGLAFHEGNPPICFNGVDGGFLAPQLSCHTHTHPQLNGREHTSPQPSPNAQKPPPCEEVMHVAFGQGGGGCYGCINFAYLPHASSICCHHAPWGMMYAVGD